MFNISHLKSLFFSSTYSSFLSSKQLSKVHNVPISFAYVIDIQ